MQLDLSALDDLDAAGVGELVRAFNSVSASGGVLRIAHPNSRVRHVLEITALLTLLAGEPGLPRSVSAGNKP